MSIISKLSSHIFNVGFFNKKYFYLNNEERYSHVKWLDVGNYNAGWFADPFILEYNGNNIKLFVEEFLYESRKGRLSLLDIVIRGDKYELVRVKPILELSTHLSFPYIFRDGQKVYVLPENSQSGQVLLYRYDFMHECLIDGVRLVDCPLVDSCVFMRNGTYYLIGSNIRKSNSEVTKSAEVYVADSLFGPYYYMQTINNTRKIERGAGQVFVSEDGIFMRPTQNCTNSYGQSVIFNSIVFTQNNISETMVYELEPDYHKPMGHCLHTFNYYEDLCVIDGLHYRFPKIGPFIIRLLNSIASFK